MARGSMSEMSPWRRRSLVIPPDSLEAWLRLAIWEMWMGMLLCFVLAFGLHLVVTAPDQVVTIWDYSRCTAPAPPDFPCERMVYQVGAMNAVFTGLFGLVLLGLAGWFLWELWSAVAPKPITDDFLKLLDHSFGRRWQNPFTWPWSRLFWAYGFTAIGAALTAGAVATLLTFSDSWTPRKPLKSRIETSQTFRLTK